MVSKNNNLTLLHCSDLHFGKYHKLDDSEKHKLGQWFEKLATEFKKRKEKIDLIIITGDIGSEGKKSDFKEASIFLKGFFKIFKGPVVIVPGNHDLRWAKGKKKIFMHKRGLKIFFNF